MLLLPDRKRQTQRTCVQRAIATGTPQELSSDEIADQIVALTEDATWAKAMSHPTRGAILRLLRSRGPTSPARSAEELDETLGTIACHFRALDKLELVEVCERVPRRGAIEHIYRLKAS